MRILLTGATGFTGRYFLTLAPVRGHTVCPLHANLCDKNALAREIEASNFDALIHFAAISFVGHMDPSEFYSVNVIGATNLLDALVRCSIPIKRVVLASSANVYGNCSISPIGESQAPAPVNHYAMSKLAMEYMARTYCDRLPIIIARPFNYTGPGQSPQFIIPKLVQHFAQRSLSVELGNVDVEREFNDVRMICDAYLALLEAGMPGTIYNLCSGHPYTLKKVIDILGDLSGYHIEIRTNNLFIRPNEVYSLYGDPTELKAVCARAHIVLQEPSLRETLCWMLNKYCNGH